MDSGHLIVAHRGASRAKRENSVAAVETAIAMGADMVEIDIRRTRDGVLVVHHDATIRGVPIRLLPERWLKQAEKDAPATLEEILIVAAGRVALDVELKEAGYEHEVLGLLGRYISFEEFIITSFLERSVVAAKRHGATTGLLCKFARHPATIIDRARRCGVDLIAPSVRLADDALLHRASDAGFPVLVWTVNESQQIDRYLAHPTVAGVITDVPDVAVARRDLEVEHGWCTPVRSQVAASVAS